ncbi:transposase family protein [Nonomuraea sp. NPDC050786]|uniref:transposase family protein n=1 Tax=Nonomuraea sp. NPDC050786 TaxID=3154840 RepID=UPI0033FB0245
MLFYRAAVDLSHQTLNYVAGVIRRHRRSMRSLWRRLNPGQQALLVLVHLRKAETFTELGAGFGVSTATAWRYVEETVALLSARSPKLTAVLRKAKRDGLHYLVLDGTLIRTDRIKADRPYFSGKHRILRELDQAGIITLAGKAYQGAEGPLVTPYKGKNKPESQQQANRSHARLRGPGERANAQLKGWKILRKLRCSPSKAGHLCKAIAVLQNHRVAQAA